MSSWSCHSGVGRGLWVVALFAFSRAWRFISVSACNGTVGYQNCRNVHAHRLLRRLMSAQLKSRYVSWLAESVLRRLGSAMVHSCSSWQRLL